MLHVDIASRGNLLEISGNHNEVVRCTQILESLYERLEKGLEVGEAEVDAALRMAPPLPGEDNTPVSKDAHQIRTLKRVITPRSPAQEEYITSIANSLMTFGVGPAGTGKTYLAVAMGVSLMLRGEVSRLILTRPAVEAGESLGFLPGDLREKVDPYLRPIYDALHDMMPSETVVKKFESGDIEVAPLAYMRGRTLADAFIILDEAQNTTPVQMKMFLTRMGENSKVVVNGDPTQIDLPKHVKSGLFDAMEVLQPIEDIRFIEFTYEDVVRHPLVAKIVKAYGTRDGDGTPQK